MHGLFPLQTWAVGRDLVSQGCHHSRGGSDEGDANLLRKHVEFIRFI